MIRSFLAPALVGVVALATFATPAQAHFIFMKQTPVGDGTKVSVFFSEDASPDPEPRLLQRLEGLEVWFAPTEGERTQVAITPEEGAMVGTAPGKSGSFAATKVFGVLERGGETYRLIYHAQTAPALESGAKVAFAENARPDLELQATRLESGKVRLVALWKGEPIPQAEVSAFVPGPGPVNAATDEQGAVEIDLEKPGFCEFRVKHVEAGEGELDGKKYPETRRYATLVVETSGKGDAAPSE